MSGEPNRVALTTMVVASNARGLPYSPARVVSTAVGTVAGGPIGDRIGRKRVIWGSIAGVIPFTLALPYAGLWLNYGGWPTPGDMHHLAVEATTAPVDHLGQALVRPGPIPLVRPVRRGALPDHWVAQGLDPQVGEQGQVLDPVLVSGQNGLIDIAVLHAVHGAFVTAPKL